MMRPGHSPPAPPAAPSAASSSSPPPAGSHHSDNQDEAPGAQSTLYHTVPSQPTLGQPATYPAGVPSSDLSSTAGYSEFDGYLADDHDMSDDGGAPLVYGDIVDYLTEPMPMDLANDSNTDDFDWDDGEGAAFVHGVGLAGHGHTDMQAAAPLSQQTPAHASLQVLMAIANANANANATATAIATAAPGADGADAAESQQQFDVAVDDLLGAFEGDHPTALSNPNPNTLGPENPGLVEFLHHWAWQARGSGFARERGRYPWLPQINEQASEYISHIQYSDLDGDRCDFQGVDWDDLGITRAEARQRRELTYKNYVNKPGSDQWDPELLDLPLRACDSYFRFRRMDVRRNVHLAHFQLRNVLACSSRSHTFYAGNSVVHQFNPLSGVGKVAMALSEENSTSQISTLAADHGVLIAGGFSGEYAMRSLSSGDDGRRPDVHEGTITRNASGITNHVQIHQPRASSSPRAAFASNDMGFRVLDLETEKFVSETGFDFPLNCSALSPDRRLRVMVGDHCNVLITTSGDDGPVEVLQELTGHRDFGFACDWADDGWTIATGFQDKAVKIWDARRWTNSSGEPVPVLTIRTEMAGVRSLRFSPLGSGKRVLVAAEEADFVNVIDAQLFRSKQTVDLFGEIGGVAFANDGQDLHVLCCDRVRGGVVQFERCNLGAAAGHDPDEGLLLRDQARGTSWDWAETTTTARERDRRQAAARRRLRAAALEALEPF